MLWHSYLARRFCSSFNIMVDFVLYQNKIDCSGIFYLIIMNQTSLYQQKQFSQYLHNVQQQTNTTVHDNRTNNYNSIKNVYKYWNYYFCSMSIPQISTTELFQDIFQPNCSFNLQKIHPLISNSSSDIFKFGFRVSRSNCFFVENIHLH